MALLEALKLPVPARLKAGKAAPATDKQEADLRTLYKALSARAKVLAAQGHQSADQLRKLADEAATDLDKRAFGGAREKLKQMHKLISGGVDAPKAPASEVKPGAGESSLAEFQSQLKTAIRWVGTAGKVLAATPGNNGLSNAMKALGDGLGQIADGLAKFTGPVAKALEIAALARKVEQCLNVLTQVRDVDLNANPDEGAAAMAELAALFGELGGELASEVPGMNFYFTIIANSGEIFLAGARLRKKYDETLKIPDNVDPKPAAEPPPKPRKNVSAKVAVKDLPDFLSGNEQSLTDSFKHGGWTKIARDIRGSGSSNFDAWHTKLMAALEREKGLAHRVRDAVHLTMKWEHDELRNAWVTCRTVCQQLDDEIGQRPDNDVTYEPALRALDAIRPEGV